MTSAYVDPQTIHNPAAGGKPPATWGDTVRDDIVSLAKPPGVRVVRSGAAQTITTATETAITFGTGDAVEDWDTDAFHSMSSNTSRITIPTGFGGRYSLHGSVVWAADSTGMRITSIKKGAATYLAMDCRAPITSGDVTVVNLSCEVALAAGEYVELRVYHTKGSGLDVQANVLNFLSARLVSWA